MPLHVRKRSKSAVGFFLENNHSLSNDPYLPSFPPHPSSSLQPRPSQPDKHRCPMWEGGVGGGGMGGHHWRKSKQTHIDSSHLNFEILEQKKRGYLLVLNNELSVMESWFCLENLSRCSRHWWLITSCKRFINTIYPRSLLSNWQRWSEAGVAIKHTTHSGTWNSSPPHVNWELQILVWWILITWMILAFNSTRQTLNECSCLPAKTLQMKSS